MTYPTGACLHSARPLRTFVVTPGHRYVLTNRRTNYGSSKDSELHFEWVRLDPGGFEEVSWRMRLFLEKHMVMGHVIVM